MATAVNAVVQKVTDRIRRRSRQTRARVTWHTPRSQTQNDRDRIHDHFALDVR